jgi:hypothetical protein
MTVSGIATGDARYYVPRCIGGFGGNMDVDATNKKVLVRTCGLCSIHSTLQPRVSQLSLYANSSRRYSQQVA